MKHLKSLSIILKDNFCKRFGRINEKPLLDKHYNSLTPTDNAEDCEIYLKSLEWALENRKTIKNIAVAGPHGSGKSSIIQTFIKQHKETEKYIKSNFFPKYKFLNISLATFKDTQTKDKSDNNDEDNNLQRLIELSILQQLFFHEEDSIIPDSRLKKIHRHKKTKLFGYSVGIVTLLISFLFLIAPDFLAKFYLFRLPVYYSYLAHYFASIITIIGSLFIIYKSSRSIIGLSIKKLNIKSAEIEIDENISKSILNNHLDEIIYFFEATKYNVFIIEDLDRFEQTEVFTKLREINLLINCSNKIKRDVVFIYAIKDDMFLDKDRVKFFDFMIPIIPVIDFSNSGNKLRNIVTVNKYKINEELLDDISMFIDDMRLLYNVMNEYYIYSKRVDSNLDPNKLLSMIVYKNIFPNDFSLLSQNDGDLYKTISQKTAFIRSEILKFDEKITELKRTINQAEDIQLNDIRELKIIYLSKIIEKLNTNSNFPFFNFIKNNTLYRISDFVKDDLFDFYQNSVTYSYQPNSITPNISFQYNAVDIENEINPDLTFKERAELIQDKARINRYKIDIEQLNEQKNQIQKSKLKDLVSNKEILVETDSNKKSDLIKVLLLNGYIDENYLDYISIFHEGALTKSDYQFLINIKAEKLSDFNYKLIKTEELIKKINEFAFEKEFILNFNLVDAIITTSNQKSKKNRLFQQLCNEKERTIIFIDEFIESTVNIELFISELCNQWTNIWNFIYSKTQYSDERKAKYFNLIIQNAELKSIAEIFKDNRNFISNFPSFLNIPVKKGKLEQIINTLDLKFNSINIESPEILLDYVLTKNHYAINIETIRTFLSYKKMFDLESFEKMNYSFILSTNLQQMTDYIESNIEEYVESVFLKLENNTEEKIDNYIKLLRAVGLSLELKEKIIIKESTIIEELKNIGDPDVIDLLFKYSKVKPTWENVLVSFEKEDNTLNTDIISYLNNISNSESLSHMRMSTDKIDDKLIFGDLCRAIIHTPSINLESYGLLTKSIPWWYESFEVNLLSKDKIIVLIENNHVQPTIISYEFLKENYKGTNILLLEKHVLKYQELINELSIDSDDLELILKSKVIRITDKIFFVNSCEEELVLDNSESVKIIAQFLADSDQIEVSNSMKLHLIMSKYIPVPNRIKLVNKYTSLINEENVDDVLISLGGAFKEITDTTKKATLENNTFNRVFLQKLVKLNYLSSFSETKKGLRVNHKRKE